MATIETEVKSQFEQKLCQSTRTPKGISALRGVLMGASYFVADVNGEGGIE